jgi:hypothetical protein
MMGATSEAGIQTAYSSSAPEFTALSVFLHFMARICRISHFQDGRSLQLNPFGIFNFLCQDQFIKNFAYHKKLYPSKIFIF